MASSVVFPAVIPPLSDTSSSYRGSSPPPTVVVSYSESRNRGPFSAASARGDTHDGRVSNRVGSLHRRGNGLGMLAAPVEHFSYKPTRVRSSFSCTHSLLQSSFRARDSSSNRQHNSGRLHQQARGNAFLPAMASVMAPLPMGIRDGSFPSGNSPTRNPQYQGGHIVPSGAETDHFRVASQPVSFSAYSRQVPSVSGSRPVRLPCEQPTSPLLQSVPPRISMAGERPILHMEGVQPLCFPTASIDPTDSNETSGGHPVNIYSSSPFLAVQTVVPQPGQASRGDDPSDSPCYRTSCHFRRRMSFIPTQSIYPLWCGPYQGILHPGGVFGGSYRLGVPRTPPFHPGPLR